jgi:hypothetical protein
VHCGIEIIHLPTGASVGHLKYESSVEELYDVKIIQNLRPGILNHTKDTHKLALNTPQFDFWSTPS